MKKTLVVMAVLLLLSVSAIAATPQYTVTDLGTLGGANSVAYDINNSGQIVGNSATSNGAQHAFLYSGGTMHDIGLLSGNSAYAFGINNSGQIVGYAATSGGATHAFLYSGGTMHDLGTFGGANSYAYNINDSGQIVGYAQTTTTTHAFLDSGGSMQDLGTLGGGASEGFDISNSGEIVGHGWTSGNGGDQPFLHSGSGSLTAADCIGPLSGGTNGVARAVNNSGQAVGWADTNGGLENAFLYNGTMHDLGTLGGTESWATDINNSGQIVGYSLVSGGFDHAFVYSDGFMQDLNNLIPSTSRWTLVEALGNNDSGQIVGIGISPSGRTVEAFLLTPIPEPSSFALLAVGGVGLVAYAWRRKRRGELPKVSDPRAC